MNHCIIMTAYKDAALINHFIAETPVDWKIYIHLDKKSKIKPKEIDPRAHIEQLYEVKWGSVNHLYAIVDLLRIAYPQNAEDCYYHIVTGQDFYVTKPQLFSTKIENGKEYLQIISDPKWYDGGKDIWKYKTLAKYIDLRKKLYRKLNRTYMIIQDLLGLCKPLPQYPIYGGSVYCSISSKAIDYILKSDIALDMLANLKDSAIGEEIFFQTVLMNSPFKHRIEINNLRYSDWSVKNAPKTLTKDDYIKLKNKSVLFCRKLCSESSLLKKLPIE